MEAQDVTTTPDSTSFLIVPAGSRSVVPTRSIDKIVTNDRFVGLLEASGIGVLAGGSAGFLVSGIASRGGGDNAFVTVGLILIGAGVGVLAGGITGLIFGHLYEYKFVGDK
jgi:hypothetical protein